MLVTVSLLSSLALAQVEGPRITTPFGWELKASPNQVVYARNLGNDKVARIILATGAGIPDLDKELLKQGVIPISTSPAMKFLNKHGVPFEISTLNRPGSTPLVAVQTSNPDGFRKMVIDAPDLNSIGQVLNDASSVAGPWVADTKNVSEQKEWSGPGSHAEGRVSGSGDTVKQEIKGDAGPGWAWASASGSSSSSSSQRSSDNGSSQNSNRSGGSNSGGQSLNDGGQTVVIDPQTGKIGLRPKNPNPGTVAPRRHTFDSDALRLPVFPRATQAQLDLQADGRFLLTEFDGDKAGRKIEGICLTAPNGYRMVDTAGRPLGLTLQIVGAGPNSQVAINGLLLRPAN